MFNFVLQPFLDFITKKVLALVPDGEAKEAIKNELSEVVKQQSTTLESVYKNRADIVKAEMLQDKFTKRARPTIMYLFAFIILMNYCVMPIISVLFHLNLGVIELPGVAWDVFKVVFSVYAISRTAEKTDVIASLINRFKK